MSILLKFTYLLKRANASLIIITIIFASLLNAKPSYKGETGSQNTVNYRVTVIDSAQNLPLEFVTVILKKANQIVNVKSTDHLGVAAFVDVEEGAYTLSTSYVGYKSYTAPVTISRINNGTRILLQQRAINLSAIVVTGSRSKANSINNFLDIKTGVKTVELQDFHPAPAARMTTVIQENLAGAVRATTGEVHIRGQHGEYSYYIDGIPIPLGVFGGLNEIVDPSVINSITFYDGGFPAEYGGQIAAIIDIKTHVPPGGFHLNLSTFGGSYLTSNNESLGSGVGSFKSLNSNGQSISLSNHIGRLGYFFTGTRDETDRRIDTPTPVVFNDHGFDYFLFGKMDYFLSQNDYLTTNLNYSETNTEVPFDPVEGINYDTQNSYNAFQTLSYYHTFSNKTDKSTNLFAGLFVREGGLKLGTSPFDQSLQYIGNSPVGYRVNQNRSFVSYGTRLKYSQDISHQFGYAAGIDFSVTNGADTFNFLNSNNNGPVNNTIFTGSDFGLFAQTNIHPFEWTRIEAGLRYDQHIAPIINLQNQLEPRLKISFFTDDFTTLYLSYDRLFIPTNIEGLSSVALAVGDSAQATYPEKDNLYVVGIIHNFLNGLTGKLDYFYKDSSPGLDDETLGSSTIRVNVNISHVHVRGIELSLNYSDPLTPFSGYINGSIIHAYGVGPVSGGFLPANNSTAPFDLDHDQRLSAVIGLNYQPSNWFLNLVGIYGSGLTNYPPANYTFKTGLFDFNIGAHTAPSWIFNISGGYTFTVGNGSTLEPSLTITNLLDHAHLIKGAFFSGASFEERRNVVFKIEYSL